MGWKNIGKMCDGIVLRDIDRGDTNSHGAAENIHPLFALTQRSCTMVISIVSLIIAVILLWWVSTDIMIECSRRKYFTACIVLTILITIAELGCILTDNTIPANRVRCIIFNTLGFALSPFVFLIESNFYTYRKNPFAILHSLPALLSAVLVLLSPWQGWIFWVSADCSYGRGAYFTVYLAAFLYSICLSLMRKIRATRHLPVYFKKRILVSNAVMLAGVLFQVGHPEYHTTWILITFFLVLYYALLCEMVSILDGLTGLLNRAAFNKQLASFRAHPQSVNLLLMVDVNDFKRVNDEKGHTYGDHCLRAIAHLLQAAFPRHAKVYRFGGDEFSILLSLPSEDDLLPYLDKLDAQVARQRREDCDFPSLAVGFHAFDPSQSACDIINAADARMYENKRARKSFRLL